MDPGILEVLERYHTRMHAERSGPCVEAPGGRDGAKISACALLRSREVHGIFVDGTDHRSCNIDGTGYAYVMRFSRNYPSISNRPGENANVQKYIGLNNNHEGLKTSMWLVPTSDRKAHGAPVGITSGASALRLLVKAMAIAGQQLVNVLVSVDGKDVPRAAELVPQDEYRQLGESIARAEETLASAVSPPALLDYQI